MHATGCVGFVMHATASVGFVMQAQGATGPLSATCQKDFNLHSCAGSCMCGPPPPPPAPPIAAAPGCGYNTSMFSQQSVPGAGCTCCDAGFDYQDSCATQVLCTKETTKASFGGLELMTCAQISRCTDD